MTTLLVHLHHHDIPFLLIGGRGLEAHGYVRNTRDLDLLLPLEVLKRIPQILSDFGYVRTAETAIFSRWISADPAAEDLDARPATSSTSGRCCNSIRRPSILSPCAGCASVTGLRVSSTRSIRLHESRSF